MKLLFKQRFFSWFDSYDIYYENGTVAYTVKGQLSWGHCLRIFDAAGNYAGTVREKVFTWLPKFELYLGDRYMGCIRKKWTWFKPQYIIDCSGWQVQGSFLEWDYSIVDARGALVAKIGKENLELDGYICFGRRRSAERPARADVHARRRRGKMFAELRQKGRFGRRLRQIAQKSASRFADRGLVYCWQIRQKGSFTEVFGIEKS